MEVVPSPEPLLQLGMGYWGSKAFLTACDLKLFSVVQAGTDTVGDVSKALSLPSRGARFLLDGMTALGLLQKERGQYTNTSMSSEYLVEEKPQYMADLFIAMNRMFYAPSVEFERALGQDSPVWSVDSDGRHVPLTGEQSELFTRGMHGLSAATGVKFGHIWAEKLQDRRHLLDLGGGSGAMSIGAVAANSGLKATVLDRPRVCTVARSYISKAGLSGSIDTIEADLFADDYPTGPDVHLYSNVFHNCSESECRRLLEKSFSSLPPAGTVVIADFILDDSRTSPTFAAVFNFLALAAMQEGECHTYTEYRTWLEKAGFVDVTRVNLDGPTALMLASKPSN